LDIIFTTEKLRKTLSSEKEISRKYGPERGKAIRRRLTELRSAADLEIMRALPQARCHELKENRKGQLAVDVGQPYRLIFEPVNSPLPTRPDGGLDWKGVTAIRLIEVVDYHGN
jgi:proteic killer suppression protein